MKKIFFLIAFLFSAFVSFSQVIPKPNPTAVGIGYKRLLADSTIFIPTGGEIPRLGANNINRRSAIYADTINKKLYVFYPNDSTWKESGTDTTSLSNRINARVKYTDTATMLLAYYNKTATDAKLNLKVNYTDTALMLSPYARTANAHGVPSGGTSGQLLSKNSNSDYDLVWIDNYADWTSLLKQYYKAAESITKGQAVYISGANGTNALISRASNDSEAKSSKTIGLAAQTFTTNDNGYVVTEGLLGNINTGSAVAGDPVWLGTNGDLIFGLVNKPYAPAHLVYIGVVTKANSSTGEILIKPQNGFELKELHDVSAQNPSNNDGIFYNSSNSLWETKSIATTLGYTPANNASVVKYTDTASMLSPYVNKAGYGLSKSGQTILADTSVLVNKAGEQIITGQKSFNGFTIFNYGSTYTNNALLYTSQMYAGKGIAFNDTYSPAIYADAQAFSINRYDTISVMRIRRDNVPLGGSREQTFSWRNTVSHQYTYPDASGTFALTSDIPSLSGYVPYSGSTSAFTTTYPITAFGINVAGSSSYGGAINIKQNMDHSLWTGTGYTSIFADTLNNLTFFWNNTTNSKYVNFNSYYVSTTTPPTYYLPNASGTLALTSQTGSLTASNFILSGGTGNTGLYYGHTDRVVLANYTAGGIDFETNGGSVNMTLFPNGNLGVGTSVTDDGVNKLQVAGSGKFTGTLKADKLILRDNNLENYIDGSNTGEVGVNYFGYSGGTSYYRDFAVYNGKNSQLFRIIGSTGASSFSSSVSATKIILSGGSDQSELTNAVNNDFKLTNSGNFRIVNNANTVAILTAKNNGYIGIGDTPSWPLDVFSTNGDVFRINKTGVAGTGVASGMSFQVTQSNGQTARLGLISTEFMSNWGGDMVFYTKPPNGSPDNTTSERMRIKANGDVSVGYVNSSNDPMIFHWNGASSYGSIQTYSSSVLALNPFGNNVGIGITSPNAKLHNRGSFITESNSYYGEAKSFSFQSAFDNPTINLMTINNTSPNGLTTIRVTVYQNGVSGSFPCNIHKGYAYFNGTGGSKGVSSMAIEAYFNGGNATVGNLSWSGNTLQYTSSRMTNYDGYTVVVEWGANRDNNAPPTYGGNLQ